MKPIFHFFIPGLILALSGCGKGLGDDTAQSASKASGEKQITLLTSRHYPADDSVFQRLYANQGYKVEVVKEAPSGILPALATSTEADVVVFPDLTYAPAALESKHFNYHGLPGLDTYYKSNLRDESGFWTGLTRRYPVIVYRKGAAEPQQLASFEDLGNSAWRGKLMLPPADDAALLTVLCAIYVQQGKDAAVAWIDKVLQNASGTVVADGRKRLLALADAEAQATIAMLDDFAYLRQPATHAEYQKSEALDVVLPKDNDGESYYTVSFAAMPSQANPQKTKVLVEFLCSQYAQGKYPAAAFEYPANVMTLPDDSLIDYMGGVNDDDMSLEVMVQYMPIARRLLQDAEWPGT